MINVEALTKRYGNTTAVDGLSFTTAPGRYLVPANYRAEFSFATNGWVTGLDGINGLAGTYCTSDDKITLRITEVGTGGGTGTFPAAEAMSSTYVSTSLTADSVTSTFTLTPHTLVLDTGRWSVTFSAKTPATKSTPAQPSSTSTPR